MGPLSIAAIGAIVVAFLYAFARKALLSLTLAVAAIVVYALGEVSFAIAFQTLDPFYPTVTADLALVSIAGALSPPWTWITFQFVHGNLVHLLLNLMGFVFIAPIVEERIGSRRWAILFFGGGAFGAAVFVLLHVDEFVALVGASAGLLAIFGGYGRLSPRERVRLFLPLPGLPAIPAIYFVVGFLLLEILLGMQPGRGVAWEAHVGGIVFGFVSAPALMRLPLGRGGAKPRLARVEGLRALATTPELRAIFAEAERADISEIRDAWVDKFVAAARCPRCGGPLRRGLGGLSSECGWKAPTG